MHPEAPEEAEAAEADADADATRGGHGAAGVGGNGESIESRYKEVDDDGKVTVKVNDTPVLVKHKSGAVVMDNKIVGFIENDGNEGALFNEANRKPVSDSGLTELIAKPQFESVDTFVNEIEKVGRGEPPPPPPPDPLAEKKTELDGLISEMKDKIESLPEKYSKVYSEVFKEKLKNTEDDISERR